MKPITHLSHVPAYRKCECVLAAMDLHWMIIHIQRILCWIQQKVCVWGGIRWRFKCYAEKCRWKM